MKGNKLVGLVVAAAVLVGLAIVTSKGKKSTPSVVGKEALPDLDVNAVARIVVNSGDSTATVAKVEGSWVLPGKFGYPADFEKVRDALLKLRDVKIGHLTRLNEAQKTDLKITTPQADGEGGTELLLAGKDGESIAKLVLGGMHENKPDEQSGPTRFGGYPDGRFLSPDGGKNVYLVSETLNEIEEDDKGWLDTELVSISSSDIRAVEITGEGRKPVKLTKPEGESKFELADVPEGKVLDTSKTYSIESALSYLRFSDVADPALADDVLGMDKPVVYRAETKKGEVYTARLGKSPESDSDKYLRLEVALEPAADQTEEPAEDATEEEKKKAEEGRKKKKEERGELEEKIASLSKKLSGWTYLIASYTAESMTKTIEDLTKDKEEEKKDGDEDAEEETEETSAKPDVETGEASATADKETGGPGKADGEDTDVAAPADK